MDTLWPPHKEAPNSMTIEGRQVYYWVSGRPGDRLIWTAACGREQWLVWVFDPDDTRDSVEGLVAYSFQERFPNGRRPVS